ncbi:hypothetical protein Salat_1873000 [Sesamum alatum]|uniref:Uncharacterized protein n=1 Tax=Sesamum alatum TaxID=300844 RepID=A0AAE1Y3A1_9LAMI|nr:hypothetical protein Salat_1873000 [Sesamum alatum]
MRPWTFDWNLLMLNRLGGTGDLGTINLDWCTFMVYVHDLRYRHFTLEIIRYVGRATGSWLDKIVQDAHWSEPSLFGPDFPRKGCGDLVVQPSSSVQYWSKFHSTRASTCDHLLHHIPHPPPSPPFALISQWGSSPAIISLVNILMVLSEGAQGGRDRGQRAGLLRRVCSLLVCLS